MVKDLIDLFISFTRATLLGFGGGPSIVPLYENEAVVVNGWLTREEFGQALAFGNALPGPIATKLAMYVGHKVAGWPGAFVAVTGVAIPTGVVLILLFGVLSRFKDSPYLKGAIAGIRPVVFVMLAMLAFDFAKYAFLPHGATFVKFVPFALAAAYFVSVQYFNLSPLYGVVGALLIGAMLLR